MCNWLVMMSLSNPSPHESHCICTLSPLLIQMKSVDSARSTDGQCSTLILKCIHDHKVVDV